MKKADVAGRTALVTGGASGIGLATAKRLHEEHVDVVMADIRADGAEVAADVGVAYSHLDVTSAVDYDRVFREILDRNGRLDILHLNAGVQSPPAGAEIGVNGLRWVSADIVERVFAVNLHGVINGIMAALKLENPPADILVTSSIAGVGGLSLDPVYAASKHAVMGFVRSVAPLLEESGVRLQVICPGGVDTSIVAPDIREGRNLAPASYIADAVINAIECGAPGDTWMATDAGVRYWRYATAPARP